MLLFENSKFYVIILPMIKSFKDSDTEKFGMTSMLRSWPKIFQRIAK